MSGDRRLDGRVAIVTGAAQGAGGGAALELAREGASVVLVGRTRSKLDAKAAEISEMGGSTLVIAADVADTPAMSAVVESTIASFGRVDALVCAAQSPEMRRARLLEIDDATITELWQSGPAATLALMKACHPHMQAAGTGSIVTFASGAMRAPANYGVYAACKAAILTISRAAAVEWGPDGIRVNTVSPYVRSPALDADSTPDQQAASSERLPLRRIGSPEEIGRVVAFLAGDASSYMTGNLVTLDGGSWHSR